MTRKLVSTSNDSFERKRCAVMMITAILLIAGCDRDPVRIQPNADPRAAAMARESGIDVPLVRFPEVADSIPSIQVPSDVASLERVLTDAELIESVRRAGGIVNIGLKPSEAPRTRSSRVIPGMRRASIVAARDLLRANGVEILRTFRSNAALVARIEPEAAPKLRGLAVVNYLEAQTFGVAQALPSVPHSGRWSIAAPGGFPYPDQDTSWGVHKVGGDSVWQVLGYFGEQATVTVIDFGPSSAQWSNSALDGPENLVNCMYVEDVTDSCWSSLYHGVMVSTIVNGRDNAVGAIGIAPVLTRLNSVNVYRSDGTTPDWAVAAALDWASSQTFSRHIVNLSIAFCDHSQTLAEAIGRAASAGLLLVAAAGNRAYPDTLCAGTIGTTAVVYPARYSQVLAVSGTMQNDSFAEYPNYVAPCNSGSSAGGSRQGPQVVLSAPFWAYAATGPDTWGTYCGTSFATPLVSGAAALVWTTHTSWTATQVRERLIETAVDLGPGGFDNKYGWGRVSAMAAASDDPWAPFSISITGPSAIQLGNNCQWYASVSGSPNGSLAFEWKINGQVFWDTSQQISYENSGPFTLKVKATDQSGYYARATLVVTINPSSNCT